MHRKFHRLSVIALTALFMLSSFLKDKTAQPAHYAGAFSQTTADGAVITILMADGYFSLTSYSIADRKFNYTWGGTFVEEGGSMKIFVEFDTWQKTSVGNEVVAAVSLTKEGLTFNKSVFKKVDDGDGELAGCWRITGRKQENQIREIPRQARKTLKLLTGNRFQWMAINTDSGEFFGSGGGLYAFKDGKYTEQIEFFSRDSSRVGASLSFDGKIESKQWHHSGKSSKGEPIYEIWSKEAQ